MRKLRRLKSRQKCNSDPLKHLSNISKITETHSGMENIQLKKKENLIIKGVKYHLCLEERKKIALMISNGENFSQIARTLGRGKQTIANEIYNFGGREGYDADKANDLSMARKIERQIKCSLTTKKHKNTTVLSRIENLEMQIEILLDTIKEMKHVRN